MADSGPTGGPTSATQAQPGATASLPEPDALTQLPRSRLSCAKTGEPIEMAFEGTLLLLLLNISVFTF